MFWWAMTIPRVIVAGEETGCGKSTVTLALMGALHSTGTTVQGFKTGPDYIDPSYYRAVTSRPGRNLDLWMLSPETVLELFVHNAGSADVAVIEGVMGLFDGAYPDGRGSTAHLATVLRAPVLLVLDAWRSSSSLGAKALGFRAFDPAVAIHGVILNGIAGEPHERSAREAVERAGLPVVGVVTHLDRHGKEQRGQGKSADAVIESFRGIRLGVVNAARGHPRQAVGRGAALVMVVVLAGTTEITAGGSVTIDGPALFMQGALLIFGFVALLVIGERRVEPGGAFVSQAAITVGSKADLKQVTAPSATEVFPLTLFSLGGMALFISASDLLTMFIALEVLSLPLYLMCALARRHRLAFAGEGHKAHGDKPQGEHKKGEHSAKGEEAHKQKIAKYDKDGDGQLSEEEKAAAKADRATAEGVIDSYIHAGSRIGAMIELNCETDFVARNPEFQKLAEDLSAQVLRSMRAVASNDGSVNLEALGNEARLVQELAAWRSGE